MTPKPLKEDKIQQQIISYLSFHARKYNFIFMAPMNEAAMSVMNRFKIPKQSQYMFTAFMRKMGFLPGVSDIMILKDGRVYCMELKTLSGTQQKSQILFQENCERTGVPYEIVRSLDGCQNQMHLWGIIQ